MADKLSWTELRRALAARANVSEKDANAFLNALNAQLVEALKEDKQVKVNGLGTFRLQAVAPRKSVNVTTGEEITIEGYNKIAFVPEAGVKELVEKVDLPEGEEATDPIQKLGAQADEIVDLLDDLGQKPNTAEPKEEPKAEEPEVEEPEAEEPKAEEPVVEEPVAEEKKEEAAPVVIAEEPKAEEPKAEEKPVEEKPVEEQPVEKKEEKKKEEKPKKSHFWRDTLICFVILLVLLVVCYFFLRHQICSWIDSLDLKLDKIELFNKLTNHSAADQEADENTLIFSEEAEEAEAEEAVAEEAVEETVVEMPAVEEASKADYPILLTEEITYGSRLAWLAQKHYGNREYWPYIYDANRDKITNPSKVAVGTKIRVPKLTAAQKDLNSKEFIRLRDEAVAAIGK